VSATAGAGRAITIESPAKINLLLDVLGRRADGYHDIRTIFQTVSLCDSVTVSLEGEGIGVASDDPALPAGEENLAGRAARALLDAAGRGAKGVGVRVQIVKRIPVGAGLGGGSGNAAATLVALDRLLGLGWGAARLEEIGAAVGSDVPFLVRGGAALGEGRGERLTRLPNLEPIPILLAKPPLSVSTRWAYDNLAELLTRSGDFPTLAAADAPMRVEALAPLARNDFEGLVMGAHPPVREARDAMLTGGAVVALMTGTGPTVFGLFTDEAKLRRTDHALRTNGFWSARVLPRRERPLRARRAGGKSNTLP